MTNFSTSVFLSLHSPTEETEDQELTHDNKTRHFLSLGLVNSTTLFGAIFMLQFCLMLGIEIGVGVGIMIQKVGLFVFGVLGALVIGSTMGVVQKNLLRQLELNIEWVKLNLITWSIIGLVITFLVNANVNYSIDDTHLGLVGKPELAVILLIVPTLLYFSVRFCAVRSVIANIRFWGLT